MTDSLRFILRTTAIVWAATVSSMSRFEAAYYKDNMTVAFHPDGTTYISKDNVMMFLGLYAYGEPRFELTYNPCNANI
jgi:hypothetical protein